jgi:L-rhamnose mutarotase
MARFAFRFRIAPGSGERYRRVHDEMSAQLREVYREAGLRNYRLFLDGEEVFAFVEADGDPAAALAAVAEHPLEVAFNAELADVIVGLDPLPTQLPEVWHLDD